MKKLIIIPFAFFGCAGETITPTEKIPTSSTGYIIATKDFVIINDYIVNGSDLWGDMKGFSGHKK